MTKKQIQKYLETNYGAKDTDIIYAKGWKQPQKSTINCPFECIDKNTQIFMQWKSPNHLGDRSAIFWGYVK